LAGWLFGRGWLPEYKIKNVVYADNNNNHSKAGRL
jgi:hypothetical protein